MLLTSSLFWRDNEAEFRNRVRDRSNPSTSEEFIGIIDVSASEELGNIFAQNIVIRTR